MVFVRKAELYIQLIVVPSCLFFVVVGFFSIEASFPTVIQANVLISQFPRNSPPQCNKVQILHGYIPGFVVLKS